jgi:hypothetical protein
MPRKNRRQSIKSFARFGWERFDYERTVAAGGADLCCKLHRDSFISCTVAATCTFRDVVEQLVTRSRPPIAIDRLASELEKTVLVRARTIFGSTWAHLDEIAQNYPSLCWWFSEKGLCMEVVPRRTPPSSNFDEVAGHLLTQARLRFTGSRLPKTEYNQIVDQLSQFPVLEYLPKSYRKRLAEWNQRHSREAIKTFAEAIRAKQPRFLHREVLRRLYRAAEKFTIAVC